MQRGTTFENRPLLDYFSINSPKLFLIAEKPLEYDKVEIFRSVKGAEYLSTCFNSKFTAMDTHVTYIHSNDDKEFCKSTLFKIFDYYIQNGGINPANLVFAFIGENSFNSFIEDYKVRGIQPNYAEIYHNEKNKAIKLVYNKIDPNTVFYIPYIILPGIDNISNDIVDQLNNIKDIDLASLSKYATWEEAINYLEDIVKNFKEDNIKCMNYDVNYIGDTLTSSTINNIFISDPYSNSSMCFGLKNSGTEEEFKKYIKKYKDVLKEALITVPVYTKDDSWKSTCSYSNEITFITHDQYVEEENKIKNNITDRAYFKVFGDKDGKPSEWYKQWHKIILPTLKLTPLERMKEGYIDSNKYEWIYDIEVFKKDWLFVAKSVDGKNKVIIWNDPFSLASWVGNKILIGFNNAAYDDVMIRHMMDYPYIKDKTITVKAYSDDLIEHEAKPAHPEFIDPKNKNKIPNFLSWDVSFHGPFDIRRNSLKKLTMSVLNKRNYDSSVPFNINRALTSTERTEVEHYCEMDVDNTRDLFLPDPEDLKAREKDPKHKMREFARDSYDIRWNLIIEYKMRAKTLINKSSSFAGKLLCGEDTKPNIKNTAKEVNGKMVFYSIPELAMKELAGTPLLDFYLQHQQDPAYIKEKFEYFLGGDDEGHKYQFGFGGLHQALLNYGSKDLVNMDVASLYPSLLIQYKLMSRGAALRPDSYEQVYNTRIEAKHTGKTLLNQGLKLVLNGAIGAMLSEFNPLFDTWSNSTICVHGQLLLFILVKRLYDAGFNIVQTNTDGIMIEKQADVDYMPICEQWMKETRLVLEFDEIAILQQNNVNNYYCQFTNGKVKSKGFYLSNEKYGKATSKILCNIVTEKPLLEGTSPRDFVIYKRHGLGEICDGTTKEKLDGRSLAFVVGYESDPRTSSYISISKNAREVVKKDEKGKPVLDDKGNQVTEIVHTESKINGFTDHMLLVDDVNTLTMEEINTREYISFAKNLLNKVEDFGPYYDINFTKVDEPAYLQSLNPLKDNTDPYPTKSGVVCQNFLFECDYLSKEEQEALIEPIKQFTYRIVWSGSRSYHIVVRINKPCTSTSFKNLWFYFQNRLGLTGADQQCNQPNRYTRVPNQENPKTHEMQTLYCENKYVFNLDEIMENIPRLKEELKQPTQYKGKVDMKALERHIKRQDWSEGNRFSACQKLSPILISQVSLDELIKMIPIKLDKNHIYVLKSKLWYWEKYKNLYEESSE